MTTIRLLNVLCSHWKEGNTNNLHRKEWQTISKLRLLEAQSLAASGHWSGAYYLAGYVVECGLKSCLTRQFKASTMPNKRLVQDAYTHNLGALVKLAGLEGALQTATTADPEFAVNWATVKDWSETSRYQVTSESDAKDMLAAVSGRNHGVMKWVRKNW